MTQREPHPRHAQILRRYFQHAHLSADLAAISKPFCELAHALVLGDNHEAAGTVTLGTTDIIDGAELTVALHKLLEAKDAAVRSFVPDKE